MNTSELIQPRHLQRHAEIYIRQSSPSQVTNNLESQRMQYALGNVGILLAFDATRLARNCTHWYQLLDLCGRMDCLIADRDGVYDPTSINGRLLLGLKGQISELELHTIRARLTAGILSKASSSSTPVLKFSRELI